MILVKYEKEITVLVNSNLRELEQLLENNNFKIQEIYDVNDIYLVKKDIKFNNVLELLNNCVMVRHSTRNGEDSKFLTYKYKEYNDKEEITKQGKVNCYIYSIDEAMQLFKYLGYDELIRLKDHSIVYSNGVDEVVVQCVNNKHIYIEIEEECSYINKKYKNINEMKEVVKKYKIPIKDDNYFAKKAAVEIPEKLDKWSF